MVDRSEIIWSEQAAFDLQEEEFRSCLVAIKHTEEPPPLPMTFGVANGSSIKDKSCDMVAALLFLKIWTAEIHGTHSNMLQNAPELSESVQ